MAYYKRTRVVSQDMRTGEFAYLDQLVKDGYNPGLLVLPKNWEPALRQGPSSFLPIVPIINLSPPNTTDDLPVIIQNLVNLSTGAAVFEMFSNVYLGKITEHVEQNVSATALSHGSLGIVTSSVSQFISGQASIVTVATNTKEDVEPAVTGVNSTGVVNVSGIMKIIAGVSTVSVVGINSVGQVGTVLNGSGWGQGGGWGSNTWGQA